MKRLLLLVTLCTLVFAITRKPIAATTSPTPTPVLLKEINQISEDSWPGTLVEMNRIVYFAATDIENGRELWRSDGTDDGTFLVKDIKVGTAGSNPSGLTVVGETLYFSADDGNSGSELWRSDGTADGTSLVKDISPTGNSSPDGLVAFNDILYFSAQHPTSGRELWRSDGTADGTALVNDIVLGLDDSSPKAFLEYGSRLYFTVFARDEYRLYSTDGTPNGLRDEQALSAPVPEMIVFKDALYFVSAVETVAFEETAQLWKLDQLGARQFKDIPTGANSSSIKEFTVVDELLYFVANDYALWKSDGSSDGTSQVAAIGQTNDRTPYDLNALNGKLFFIVTRPLQGMPDASIDHELWVSDGTENGTTELFDFNPTSDDPVIIDDLSVIDNTLYVATGELWRTDGTADGMKKLVSSAGRLFDHDPSYRVIEDRIVFVMTSTLYGREIFSTDGDVVTLVHDINAQSDGSFPAEFVVLDNNVVFTADDGITDTPAGFRPLWVTNGTPVGTEMLRDSEDRVQATNYLVGLNDHVYYRRSDGTGKSDLWKTDGTAAGSQLVHDGSLQGSVRDFAAAENRLFFISQEELWVTDGSSGGTRQVANVGSFVSNLTNVGNNIFMTAQGTDGAAGQELWFSDGTTNGTKMLKDINAGSADSFPSDLAVINGQLYFSADNGTDGSELWVSDGTTEGTRLVKNINMIDAAAGSDPESFVSYAGLVYFSADDSVHGRELWVTDGTAEGTQLFKDMNVGGSADPTSLTRYDGELYFVINSTDSRREIWRTDGNPANVTQVTNISPSNDANPQYLTVARDWLYFTAADDTQGIELYRTDGTTVEQLGEINPTGDATPRYLTEFNGKLIFQARRAKIDSELWYVPLVELNKEVFLPIIMR